MTTQQMIIFGLLAATLGMFIWNCWRYDIVSIAALLAGLFTGIVPTEEAFSGFGHPAVITVVAVLIISRGLINAGVVDVITGYLGRIGSRPTIQVAALTLLVMVCSAVMNNVGALALLMPVAIWMSRRSGRSPSLLLMPLAFGSLMGGMITLIGTPPNIIIASYRAEVTEAAAAPFGMFDFAPVGAGVSLAGLVFITLIGWRLTSRKITAGADHELFQIKDYISEVRIPEKSKFIGQTIHDLLAVMSNAEDVTVVGLVRGEHRRLAPSFYWVLRAGDILMVETDSETLKVFVDSAKLELVESKEDEAGMLESEDVVVREAFVSPESRLLGRTASNMQIRDRYGVNVLAVARRGQRIQERLGDIRFVVGDILLLQGGKENLQKAITELGCLPLAERALRIGKPRKAFLSMGIFGIAIAATGLGWLPPETAFISAAVVMVLARLISPGEVYKSVDWAVIVLLGALIPLGHALETTGGAQLIAGWMLNVSSEFSPSAALYMILIVTMLLSNVVNNAAAAILMAPIAVGLAQGMSLAIDPFLMAVAVGASCAFMTPIGHQSNALVMAPGGYRFIDYFRMGLPLSILVAATAVPLIMRFWPV